MCSRELNFYRADKEAHLAETAREGVQLFLGKLFSLPTQSSPDGPLALLPKPTTPLPRAKPLPKPKPPTKWEQFAAAKGISKTIKDRKVWDEERQEWVNRWGMHGKNKDKEEQWIHELPDKAGKYCPFLYCHLYSGGTLHSVCATLILTFLFYRR